MPEILIDDYTPIEVDGLNAGSFGLVARDVQVPPGYYGSSRPADMKLIPRIEWPERLRDMEKTKSRLSDIRNIGFEGKPVPYVDQGSYGYCWAHGVVNGVQVARAVMGQPYVPLSAYAVAATIKNGRDEGAWGALALDFITKRGVPSQEYWPQGSVDLRLGTDACWDNAKLHQVTEGWYDLESPLWNRDLSWDQQVTCLLNRWPVVCDYSWWGHCVCALDLIDFDSRLDLMDPNRWGVLILNSWRNWGDNGTGKIRGKRAVADNAVAIRVTDASVK